MTFVIYYMICILGMRLGAFTPTETKVFVACGVVFYAFRTIWKINILCEGKTNEDL